MKKMILIISIVFVAICAYAQDYTCDSLLYMYRTEGGITIGSKPSGFTEMRDGNILINMAVGISSNGLGDKLFKISRQGLSVMESVFIECTPEIMTNYTSYDAITLLRQNPDGNGYFSASLVNDRTKGSTWLRIVHFDEDLVFEDPDEAFMIPLEDTIIRKTSILLEGNENIVLMYLLHGDPVLFRIGIDGTPKEKNVLHGFVDWGDGQPEYWRSELSVFNESPLEYAFYDWDVTENDTCLKIHVVDSLFGHLETIPIGNHYGDVHLIHNYNYSTCHPIIMSLDDSSWCVATQYTRYNIVRNGTCILKFDKNTNENLGVALFESWPIYTNPRLFAYPIGMEESSEGFLYFAYRTNNIESPNNKGWLAVVKMDANLNTIWQRYFLGSTSVTNGYWHTYCHSGLIDQGMMVYGNMTCPVLSENKFLYVFYDNVNDIQESESFVRPYAFYPNPTTDVLILEYSPDVKPTSIELYDLQGRLVRSQRNGLESIDMGGLPTGTYTLRVTLEDGKAYTDKVVKE